MVDLESLKLVGEIPDTLGAHSAVVVPDLGVGFTSNGRENTSSVFDPKTLKVSDKIKTGEGPDAIVYDPASGNVFTMNGHGKSASVIDPKNRVDAKQDVFIADIPGLDNGSVSGRRELPQNDVA